MNVSILLSFYVDLASGSSIDWVYAKQNVNLTYTFEFRDKGNKHLTLKFLSKFELHIFLTFSHIDE